MSSPKSWIDYTIHQHPNGDLTVVPDSNWPTELLDKKLFEVGDIFVVNENGKLVKMDKLTKWLIKGQWDEQRY